MSSIGKNIARRRKEIRMTQEELAKKMGYKSISTIAKIESGINDIPQSKIVQFAQVLETTPSVLMGWVNEEQDKKNDDLVQIIVKMRRDARFRNNVFALSKLNEEQSESIEKLLSAFRGK